jgi:hypothetical protein
MTITLALMTVVIVPKDVSIPSLIVMTMMLALLILAMRLVDV